ncbi:hypothetical protein OAV67_04820 [Alphaproteobacteria bacterium]|nr:hypothetical protein [Alphaproteobacteria bacterium]
MMSKTDKNAHIAQDGALFDKIETLYLEADVPKSHDPGHQNLKHDDQSGPLEASTRVKSQDATRLPIIGSLPVTAISNHNVPKNRGDGSIPLSSISKDSLMTSIVLTGMVSRPGREKEPENSLPASDMPIDEAVDKNTSAPSDDPFVAIRNAVEIAGQTIVQEADTRPTMSEASQISTQTKKLASALAIIIKEQIDNALDNRLAPPDRADGVNPKPALDNSNADKTITASKRAAAKLALKKAAKFAQNNAVASVKRKTKTATAKASAKKTEAKAKPTRKKSSKVAGAKDD